jgi:hypothetical protein
MVRGIDCLTTRCQGGIVKSAPPIVSTFAIGSLITCLVATLPAITLAQSTAHYPTGLEGILGASLPPPGLYLRDYNIFYTSSRLDDASGGELRGSDLSNFDYGQAPRLVWITNKTFLGGYLGADLCTPIVDENITVNTPEGQFKSSTFNIGDPFLEGSLSWHPKSFDLGVGVGEWFPIGQTAPPPTTDIGLGYWETMLTGGVTWYPDAQKNWAVSLLNRYEINSPQRDTHITTGNVYTLEWGVSNAVMPTLDLGIVGYYQQEVTPDSGPDATHVLRSVAAVGPEVLVIFPKLNMIASLSYYDEVLAVDRSKGQEVSLVFTWKL